MAQVKTFSWTNPSSAVARNLNCGFEVAQVITIDVTNGGSWQWLDTMPDAYYLDVDAGTITTSNGVTPLAQSPIYGATISGMTEDNPAVITATNIAQVGIVAGDTIKVAELADDGTGTTLNGSYTVASVTTTTITTGTNTSSGYATYVSGGVASRVSDTNGDPIATNNFAIRGVTLGTGVVGANSAVMVAICFGKEPVE